ncbi:GTPase activating protein [Serendipita sp. 396]|nr:GTPase activating protein [Serendipita sp. 396]KAG8788039.1 GTPase activating protein [Serendipita sp. 397]
MGGGNTYKNLDEDLSTVSVDDMVQINYSGQDEQPEEDKKYSLLYSKSAVFVHPTAYKRDNLPGFVSIVRKDGLKPSYLLAWIPESMLREKGDEEWSKFTAVESSAPTEEEDAVLVDIPSRHGEPYAFSVPLSSVYSLIIHPPSFSSWYGSITIHLGSGETLPTLFFHDDESRSFNSIAPGSSQPLSTWGGEDLLARLRCYANVLRSSLQNNLYLVDPSRADIETHTTVLFSDDAVDEILSPSSSTPRHRQRSHPPSSGGNQRNSNRNSVLHQTLSSPSTSQTRMALLNGFSQITRGARTTAQRILSHPLAKPIVPYLPDPVNSLVNVNGEWASWVEKGGVGEYESARVYLARWARIVAEEGERSRQREIQSQGLAGDDEEDSGLGVFEIIRKSRNVPTSRSTRDPKHPVDREMWAGWFAGDGRPIVPIDYMRQEIFRRGCAYDVRQKAWPFILGVLPWDADEREREILWARRKAQYQDIKSEWYGVQEVFDRQDIQEERHRIDVDCRRTDRAHPMFLAPSSSNPSTPEATGRRTFTFSPSPDEIGAQALPNEHTENLCEILLSYGFYEKNLANHSPSSPLPTELSQLPPNLGVPPDKLASSSPLRSGPRLECRGNTGYVQGMSDLCAPIYVIMKGDEVMTFWCFVALMERMKQNFLRDQSGMKRQLATLQQLIAVMDPELYKHFEKTDSLNLFFCFRWILIAFKREFSFDDVLGLWEVLWTDHYSTQFLLFVALAVLESHREGILRYLVEFDEVLKYCNQLSMTIELDSTLAQAEVLFLSFRQMVQDVDRRQAELLDPSGLRQRRGDAATASTEGTEAESVMGGLKKLPHIAQDLRNLIKSEPSP